MDGPGLKQALDLFKTGIQASITGLNAVAAVVAEEGSGLIGQSKLLHSYKLGQPVATSGPGDAWTIYQGSSKKQGALQKDVSIWILDKKRIQETAKQASKVRFEQLFEQQKRACQQMTRLKHPGVIKVIEPVDDQSQQMVLVTEPVFGSLSNVMRSSGSGGGARGIAGGGGGARRRRICLSPLEVKQGLLQVVDTLNFLHNEARTLHGGLSPQVIMITSEGVWKLAGFGFTLPLDPSIQRLQRSDYRYDDPFPPTWDELAKPLLPYAAPEVVGGISSGQHMGLPTLTAAADVFSLATTVYEVLCNGQQLLPVRSNLSEYRSRVEGLTRSTGLLSTTSTALAAVPESLQGVLQVMLSPSPESRPPVASLTATPFFQEDTLLRAIRFLDTILQREHAQKLAFIQDLSTFWTQFDDRVLQLRVLPPLIQELRSELLQPVLLPLVLSMLERCSPQQFMASLLPALQPVMEAAQGHLLGALLAGSGTLARLMTQEAVSRYLIPLYSKALDSEGSPQVQDLCLRMLQSSLSTLDFNLLRSQIMPRTHSICMRTTTASVRANALALMAAAASRLGKAEAGTMIDTVAQVVGVDKSAATVMGVVQLCVAIAQAHGVEVTAVRLIPLVAPLMVAPSLTPQEFRTVHGAVQGMLDSVAAKLSGGASHAAPAGLATATPGGGAGSSTTNSTAATGPASWDAPLELSSYSKPKPHTSHTTTATPHSNHMDSWLTAPATATTAPTTPINHLQPPASSANSHSSSNTAGQWDWLGAGPTSSSTSSHMKPTVTAASNSTGGPSWSMGPLSNSTAGGGGGVKAGGAPMVGAGATGGVPDLFGGLVLHGGGASSSMAQGPPVTSPVKSPAANSQPLDPFFSMGSNTTNQLPGVVNGNSSTGVGSGAWTGMGSSNAGAGGGSGGMNGFSALASVPHHTMGGSSMMQGKPMLGGSSAAGSDPFSSLTAMALSTPAGSAPSTKPHPAHVGHPSKVGLLPPPPRASQAIMSSSNPNTPSAQHAAAAGKNPIDDLLF